MDDTTSPPTSIEPADQRAAWNGPEGANWAKHSERATPGGDFSADVLEVADLERGEHVLDIGCGIGTLTRDAARIAVDGHALGVDLSAAMIERARQIAVTEGVANVAFTVDDVATHRFDEMHLDVALSHFGVMFFDDPVTAFANVATALRPGGRRRAVRPAAMERCDWYVVPLAALAGAPPTPADAPSVMFSLADPVHIRRVLRAAGFSRIEVEPFDGALWFGDDARTAAEMYLDAGPVQAFLQRHPSMTDDAALDTLVEAVAPYAGPDGVRLQGAHWMVRAVRAEGDS